MLATKLTEEDAKRAEALWAENQRTHDVSDRVGQTVGTERAFWMRIARACATEGARLTPRAPSAPSAAVTPPESLTKSRRDTLRCNILI